MKDIDPDNNPIDFSLLIRTKILSWIEKAMTHSNYDSKEAIKIYSCLIDVGQYQDHIYTNRGIAYYQAGENKKAIDDLQKAIFLNPDNELALTTLSKILSGQQV